MLGQEAWACGCSKVTATKTSKAWVLDLHGQAHSIGYMRPLLLKICWLYSFSTADASSTRLYPSWIVLHPLLRCPILLISKRQRPLFAHDGLLTFLLPSAVTCRRIAEIATIIIIGKIRARAYLLYCWPLLFLFNRSTYLILTGVIKHFTRVGIGAFEFVLEELRFGLAITGTIIIALSKTSCHWILLFLLPYYASGVAIEKCGIIDVFETSLGAQCLVNTASSKLSLVRGDTSACWESAIGSWRCHPILLFGIHIKIFE